MIAPLKSVIDPVAIVMVPSILASSSTVKSSVDVNCSADTVPEAVTFPVTVCAPDATVPVVDKFSSPNVIAPPESVILPSDALIVPIEALELDKVVNSPAAGVDPPIIVLSIVPATTVKSSATYSFATTVPCHIPEPIVPTSFIDVSLSVVMIVPVTLGNVIIWSDVGSTNESVV